MDIFEYLSDIWVFPKLEKGIIASNVRDITLSSNVVNKDINLEKP